MLRQLALASSQIRDRVTSLEFERSNRGDERAQKERRIGVRQFPSVWHSLTRASDGQATPDPTASEDEGYRREGLRADELR